MKSMRILLGLLVAFTGAWLATPAAAARLDLRDGGSVVVEPYRPMTLPGLSGAVGLSGHGLRYAAIDSSGRTWQGAVPQSAAATAAPVSLAQSPVTGDVFLVFARRRSGGEQLVFSTWTGQSFSEPQWLTGTEGTNLQPRLAFRRGGEAILSWRVDGALGSERLLVRYFELAPSGEIHNHSFSDLGNASTILESVPGPSGLQDGLAGLVISEPLASAYIFVADADTGSAGLVRLALRYGYDGSGFSAPPVPVTFSTQMVAMGGSGAIDAMPLDPAVEGDKLAPYRLNVGPITAYYWLDNGALEIVLFRDGEPGALRALEAPATEAGAHALAYAVAREQADLVAGRTPASVLRDGARRKPLLPLR